MAGCSVVSEHYRLPIGSPCRTSAACIMFSVITKLFDCKTSVKHALFFYSRRISVVQFSAFFIWCWVNCWDKSLFLVYDEIIFVFSEKTTLRVLTLWKITLRFRCVLEFLFLQRILSLWILYYFGRTDKDLVRI